VVVSIMCLLFSAGCERVGKILRNYGYFHSAGEETEPSCVDYIHAQLLEGTFKDNKCHINVWQYHQKGWHR
jgi:hypothetical protein